MLLFNLPVEKLRKQYAEEFISFYIVSYINVFETLVNGQKQGGCC